jgi:hypothetical protein
MIDEMHDRDTPLESFQSAYDNGIAAFCRSRHSAKLIRQLDAKTWDRGGCTALAKALKTLFGGELISLGPDPSRYAEHVLLKTHGIYLDCTGSYTEDEILSKWRRGSGRPTIDLAPVTMTTTLPFAFDELFIFDVREALKTYLAVAERLHANLRDF